jgi:nucleoside-diphosphate-sugar epimerase
MARYLVTGSAGFIGSAVSRLLLKEGHNVVGIDNLNDSYDVRLKEWRLEQIKETPGFSFHRMDICDSRGLRQVFSTGIDGVINLAARAGVRQSVEIPGIYYETNLMGCLNMLDLCRDHDVKKFVLASTSSLYGSGGVQPFSEDADTNKPLSPYAASKKAAEALCYSYHSLYRIDVSVLRYFTVYGPAGRPDMSLFRFVQWISEGRTVKVFGDGNQTRDFTYVDDIAAGTVAALKPLGFEVINLGSDSPLALIEIIRLVERSVGKPASVEHLEPALADVPATWADIGKAGRLLGWRPKTTITDGIENLVAWYRANREWAKDVVTG